MDPVSGVLQGVVYHQFYLCVDADDAYLEYATDEQISPHGLVAPSGHAVCVTTGIAMGAVGLTIEFLDEAPATIDERKSRQAVSDVSFEATSTSASVRILMNGTVEPFDGAFDLPAGSGWYRVRGHVFGRSLDFDIVVNENPREHHLLQVWRTDGPQPLNITASTTSGRTSSPGRDLARNARSMPRSVLVLRGHEPCRPVCSVRGLS